jgi:hypothetical protein
MPNAPAFPTSTRSASVRRAGFVAVALGASLSLILAGCSGSGAGGAHAADAPPGAAATSAGQCNDDANKGGAYQGRQTLGHDYAVDVPVSQFTEALGAAGNTVFAGGRDPDWSKAAPATEAPAHVARLKGATGKVLNEIALDGQALNVEAVDPGRAAWDTVAHMVVGPSRVYVTWQRFVDGIVTAASLVALDACSLAVLAVQTLPHWWYVNPGDSLVLAYDGATNTVWVPSSPESGQVTGYNGATLGVAVTATLVTAPDYSRPCLADWGGTIWFTGSPMTLQKIDPTSGAVSVTPITLTGAWNCVQTDGQSLYLAQDHQLLALDASGTPGTTWQMDQATVTGVANEQVWATHSDGPTLSLTSLTDGTTGPVQKGGVAVAATTTNLWIVGDDGGLQVLLGQP